MFDGQHRCESCVQSGEGFDTLIWFGVPDEAFPVTDTGAPRTASDASGYVTGERISLEVVATVRAFLDGLSDKEQAALREDDSVAPIIAEIKAEKAADKPKMDTKSILAKLG